jgi:hypothetical protein
MKPKTWVIGSCSVILLSLAIYFLVTQTKLTSGIFQSKIAHVEIEDVVAAHPDWAKYQKLQKELLKLRQSWANQSGEKLDLKDNLGSGRSELDYQMTEIERIYNEELQFKITNLNKTLSEYSKKHQAQVSATFKEKVDQLNEALNKELGAKSEEMAGKVDRFRSQTQAEHQLELSNLQLQLSMLDMSLSPNGNNREEKDKIQAQINQINREIDSKIAGEQKKLQEEFNRFAKERKDAVTKEAESYQVQLRQQLEEDIKQFQNELKSEFNQWQQKRKIELDATIKSRKAQSSAEYKRYSSEQLILESQMEQIKETILWQIRKETKKLAREKKLDVVITGDLAKSKTNDLTRELKEMVQ